jgi:hypothetical protein
MSHVDALAPTIPMKPPSTEVPGIDAVRRSGAVAMARRWLRPKHYVLLAAVSALCVWVGGEWGSPEEATGVLYAATFFCVSWTIALLGMFVNRTTIVADKERVDVKHGPLPSVFARSQVLERKDGGLLYVAAHGSHYAVRAKMPGGGDRVVVAPLITSEQARFVERELQKVWGQSDQPVQGELSAAEDLKGLGALGLVVPLAVGAVLLGFMNVASSEVAGELQASGDQGAWSFTADDCASGQREGFAGVSLSSSESTRTVRLVNDPIKGKLLVVAEQGGDNRVIDGTSCSKFQLDAGRTSTVVNDIWVVEGQLNVQCPDIKGQVQFSGCR